MFDSRDYLKKYQKRMMDKSNPLEKDEASEILMEISALLGNMSDAIIQADQKYNLRLLEELEKEEKANRAKIKAETSDEYIAKQQARNTKELATELIRSLKYFIRSREDDWGAGRNM